MSHPERFLHSHSIQTHFATPCFQYGLSLQIPDLSAYRRRLWGDWGPMYTIFLDQEVELRVEYRSVSRALSASYIVKPGTARLDSPMLARDRVKFPFYLAVEDELRGLRFLVFFDHKATVHHTKVEQRSPHEDVDPFIFPQTKRKLSA